MDTSSTVVMNEDHFEGMPVIAAAPNTATLCIGVPHECHCCCGPVALLGLSPSTGMFSYQQLESLIREMESVT